MRCLPVLDPACAVGVRTDVRLHPARAVLPDGRLPVYAAGPAADRQFPLRRVQRVVLDGTPARLYGHHQGTVYVHPDAYRRNKFGANTGWKISDQNWNGVFLSETSFGVNGGIFIDNKAHTSEVLSASFKVQHPMLQKLRLNISSGAGIVFNGLITDKLQKGTGSVTILDDKFSAPKILGTTSGLELAVYQHRKIGTISIY